jgi:hypothetical protein
MGQYFADWNNSRPAAFGELRTRDVIRHCNAMSGFNICSLDQLKAFLRLDTEVSPIKHPPRKIRWLGLAAGGHWQIGAGLSGANRASVAAPLTPLPRNRSGSPVGSA